MIDTRFRSLFQPVFDLMAKPLAACGVSPLALTFAAMVTGVGAAGFILLGWQVSAVCLLWFSGLLDVLDGSLARQSGQVSQLGAFFDIVGDRVVEVAVILALAISRPYLTLFLAGLLSAILISMTVFLVSGALLPNDGEKSFRYQAGWAERTEGFLFFTGMILFPVADLLITGLFIFAVCVTAAQRLRETAGHLKKVEVV